MKKEFWIKKDPVKDGQDNWKKLSSYEFARFMETADGKSRKENIARIPGGEPGEPIIYMEVDSQTAKEAGSRCPGRPSGWRCRSGRFHR